MPAQAWPSIRPPTAARCALPTPSPRSSIEVDRQLQDATAAGRSELKLAPAERSRIRSLAGWLWERNLSPFAIVRMSLGFGPLLVSQYTTRRFAAMEPEELAEVHDYTYNVSRASGSGEYSLTHLLAPGAFARSPLVRRVSPLKIPTTWIYGGRDWMDPQGGYDAIRALRKAGNSQGKVRNLLHIRVHTLMLTPICPGGHRTRCRSPSLL